MKRAAIVALGVLICIGAFELIFSTDIFAESAPTESATADFPRDLQGYGDAGQDIPTRLLNRIRVNPFNLIATLIFLAAIIHTFLASRFTRLSHEVKHVHEEKIERGEASLNSVSGTSRLLHFFGEVEVVFGLWAIPLLLAIVYFFDWSTVVDYMSHGVNYTEPMFVVVIMILASSRPVLKLSEMIMNGAANLLGGSLAAWWLSILTLGPLLGSFITEPAAMTISALLLSQKFYALEPSTKFKYSTLGLLFVNTSVGGTLTHFAAPPILMVAAPWGWGLGHMLVNFGWKAATGILISNVLYWFLFRSEFASLREKFTLRTMKQEILTRHLSRESVEREMQSIISDLQSETHLNDDIRSRVDEFSATVGSALEAVYLKRIAGTGIDPALAIKAFRERFEEIRLYRLQRELPHLLLKEQRAPFRDPNWDHREDPVPSWVMLVHMAFMAWTIVNAHHPALFMAGVLFFLGFATVTADYQNNVDLRAPLLVGFFLGGLVTHGGVQGWWIEPVLGSLSEIPLRVVATTLTAFNDNAAITYLSTLVPNFTDTLKYAVVAGAVTGGGLTVIANAPNPAGQALLKSHFSGGVSPGQLLKAALVPTAIMFIMFLL